MTFEPGAELENYLPLKRTLAKFVQGMNGPEPHRHAAAKATRRRNVSRDGAAKRKGPALRARKERVGRRTNHLIGLAGAAPGNRDLIVEAEGNPEAIEAGSEIRRTPRNSDGDLLHDGFVAIRRLRNAMPF